MKRIVMISLAVLLSNSALNSAFAKDAPNKGRKPSSTECAANTKQAAQSVINIAAKSIGFDASDLALSWVNATGTRYTYAGSIYKGNYEVIVKTDSSCFIEQVELVDLARR